MKLQVRHHKQNILFPIADWPTSDTDPTYLFFFFFAIFSHFLVSIFCSRTQFIFHSLIARRQECSNVARVFFLDVRAQSNMAFVIYVLQFTSKNSIIKSWIGLMMDGKHKMNTLYHLFATGHLDKGLFLCFVVVLLNELFTPTCISMMLCGVQMAMNLC